MKKIFTKNNIFTIITFIGLYFLFTGVSFAFFKVVIRPQQTVDVDQGEEDLRKGEFLIDVSGPKTEVCPINGQLFTEAEKNSWEKRRPLIVMVENHADSRPPSGISKADVIYEAVAEGGITRFTNVFYCDAQAQEVRICPVRSARTYFLDWASEYGEYPLYAHVGGANTPGPADALGQITNYGWRGANDLDQFGIGKPTFEKFPDRLGYTSITEHTMCAFSEKLWDVGKARGFEAVSEDGQDWTDNFEEWKFGEALSLDERGDVNKISFEFWSNAPRYNVDWQYDKENNDYLRSNGGEPHKDLDFDTQLNAKNVIVLFMTERQANDGYENNAHLLYGTTGKGDLLAFQNGEVIKGTWQKKSRLDRTRFYDDSGKEIQLVPGKTWIEILPVGNKVSY